VPSDAECSAALRNLGHQRVHVEGGRVWFDRPGVQLGIASFGKGAIIDLLFQALRARGHDNLVVNVGGDLRTAGCDANGEPWRFRVVDPDRPSEVAAELVARDVAIATSGNSFRARRIQGERFGHLLDVSTGWPAAFDGSVTVLTRDAAMADALATALLVMGPERGLAFAARLPGVEALFLSRAGRVATAGLSPTNRLGARSAARWPGRLVVIKGPSPWPATPSTSCSPWQST
jgi:thiamine biosynthesis lipoprotein